MSPCDPVRQKYQRGICHTYTIPEDALTGGELDLVHNYRVLSIQIKDYNAIQASTTIRARVDWGCNEMVPLCEQDDPNELWNPTLPNTRGSGFILTHCFSCHRIEFLLNNAPVQNDLVLLIMGHDQGEFEQ